MGAVEQVIEKITCSTCPHFIYNTPFKIFAYSQRKKRMDNAIHITARKIINRIGKVAFSNGIPKEVVFRSLIPWVSGRKSEVFCITLGIISYGRVAPEKKNMGK